jgi:hypothetical protein
VSKAIVVKIYDLSYLAETDSSIEIPSDFALRTGSSGIERDNDFEEVIDLGSVERSFAEIKCLIVGCCNSLHEAIADIPDPEKVAIEFGIKLVGEAGFPMITKASGEANFKINIEWKSAARASTQDG